MSAALAKEDERLRGTRADIDARDESLKARRKERDGIKDALNEIEVSRARIASDQIGRAHV